MTKYFSGGDVTADDVAWLTGEAAKAHAAYDFSHTECCAKAIAMEKAGVESALAAKRVAKSERKLAKRRNEAAVRLANLETAKTEVATAVASYSRCLQIFNVAFAETNEAKRQLAGESK